MARFPEGRQRLAFGCYYTMEPGKKFSDINVKWNIKWYGLPVLMWKVAHLDHIIKWYQYPWLVYLIGKHTIRNWLGK